MYAVEFQTTIKNGVIEIPVEYQQNLRSVRVILLAEDVAQTTKQPGDQ